VLVVVEFELAQAGRCRSPGRVCGGAEDPDPAGGVFDDGEDVLALSGPGDRFGEVDSQQCVGLTAQEVGSGAGRSVWCGIDALDAEDLPHCRRGDLDSEGGEFAVDTSAAPSRIFADQGRMERTVGGRPRRFRCEMCACRCRIRSRCQRRTVSGRTSNCSRRKTVRGKGCSSAARNARSAGVKVTGRRTCWSRSDRPDEAAPVIMPASNARPRWPAKSPREPAYQRHYHHMPPDLHGRNFRHARHRPRPRRANAAARGCRFSHYGVT